LILLAAALEQIGGDEACAEADALRLTLEGSIEIVEQCEVRATATLERLRSAAAAQSRRRAVLEGLASLGYEVSEQMETAWVANGRVVLRQPARPGYGVEIGGGADAGRVQVRTVAFRDAGAAPDAARDRDAETLWCGEFGELRERFASAGGEIVIEQALGIGVAPLRAVGAIAEPPRDAQAELAQTIERRLK